MRRDKIVKAGADPGFPEGAPTEYFAEFFENPVKSRRIGLSVIAYAEREDTLNKNAFQ